MDKNLFMGLVIGLMVGMVLGYVLAESQAVPPVRAMQPPGQTAEGLPSGHPPLPGNTGTGEQDRALATQITELQNHLEQSPGDTHLMTAIGNLYFDAQRWVEARDWYQQVVSIESSNTNVMTDLAVVMRNLNQHEDALDLLNRALELNPDHWQALYNKVIVLHFDLHRHKDANLAFTELVQLKKANPAIPDLSSLQAELEG
ncbi:MAG: tetratricopeptide repeat protein [bacterium]|nr:tetratricopeptide repeat protein [bacterium]